MPEVEGCWVELCPGKVDAMPLKASPLAQRLEHLYIRPKNEIKKACQDDEEKIEADGAAKASKPTRLQNSV